MNDQVEKTGYIEGGSLLRDKIAMAAKANDIAKRVGQPDIAAGNVAAKKMTKVPDKLESLASIYRERGGHYGDNYLHMGKVFMGLFPRGVVLDTEEKFNRFHFLVHLTSKLSRYTQMFEERGHPDSFDDLSIYAQMANEYDDLVKSFTPGNDVR